MRSGTILGMAIGTIAGAFLVSSYPKAQQLVGKAKQMMSKKADCCCGQENCQDENMNNSQM